MSRKILKAKEKTFGTGPDNCCYCIHQERVHRRGCSGWTCNLYHKDLPQGGIFRRPAWCRKVSPLLPLKEEQEQVQALSTPIEEEVA